MTLRLAIILLHKTTTRTIRQRLNTALTLETQQTISDLTTIIQKPEYHISNTPRTFMARSKENQKYDYLGKVVVIGDSAVGKTNILLRYTNNDYKPSHLATVGVDFKIKTVQVGDKKLRLQIWDTAGQERFKTITQTYYKGSSGIILVYAVNDKKSFDNISMWMGQISQNTREDIPRIIMANKSDVSEKERVISTAEGQALADKYQVPFFEGSAKQNLGINSLFNKIAEMVVDRLENEPNEIPSTIRAKINAGSASGNGKKRECC